MIGAGRANRPDKVRLQVTLTAALFFTLAGCSRIDAPAVVISSPATLTVAFGLATGTAPESGAQQAVGNITNESLIGFAKDGRPQARLAESWSLSPDGLSLRVHLRNGATFHDGQAVTADDVGGIVSAALKDYLGPAFADIDKIRATSSSDLEIDLKRRTTFALEALDVGVRSARSSAGTGPFKVTELSASGAKLVANEKYYGGKPLIERIEIRPYASVRAAWADMLRGQVDMLYEVGSEAIDLMQSSKAIKVITHLRNYEYVVLLNVQRPVLRSAEFRQALNNAIDRDELVKNVLKGLGTPGVGSVWPSHWAYDTGAPVFRYEPRAISPARQFTCIIPDPSLDRLGLLLQRQLHAVGVDVRLEAVPLDKAVQRIAAGDFDAILTDAQMGPTLLQAYRFWAPGNRRNWGKFDSRGVNLAFDQIRDSVNDNEYRAGVSALQQAIYEDPPAIFLAWSQRARAVSSRFDVPVEPGRDILGTLRQWRPVAAPQIASRN